MTTQKLIRFGAYELNLATEELHKNGIFVKLSPQPFRILALLASRSGQIVSREEIRQQVWGEETFVDFEHGMNQCVKQIRRVLCDNPDQPTYIETLPRKGYRFLVPVTVLNIPTPAPRVVGPQEASEASPISNVDAGGGSAAAAVGVAPASAAGVMVANADGAVAVAAVAARPVLPAQPAAYHNWLSRTLVTLVIVGLIIGLYRWHLEKASAFTEQQTVVLGDFSNTTGDPNFDIALRQALIFDLEQSSAINLLSEERVYEELGYMGLPKNTRLTQEVTRQICQRTGSKAMITGSISALGSHYQVALDAINCTTGDSLGSEVQEANSREASVKALNRAAAALRQRLGEKLPSVEKTEMPAEEATTPSIEALVAFNQARTAQITGNGDAIYYFKRAIELDPNLAVAYAGLAAAYDNAGQLTLALENYTKAYEMRDRVSSQQERFIIEGHYYDSVTGELEKASQVYQQWARDYPANYKPHENLAVIYAQLGQYEKAVAEAQQTVILKPDNVLGYTELVANFNALDRLDEARDAYEQAQSRGLQYPQLALYRYYTAFLQDDTAAMQQQFNGAMGNGDAESYLLSAQSDSEAYYGHLEKARTLTARAVQSANRADEPETAAQAKAMAALREAELGNPALARREANDALAMVPGRYVQVIAALALARAGDTASAAKIADQLDQQYPHDTMNQVYSLPVIRAAIELAENNPEKAIETLQVAIPYELGSNSSIAYLYPAYLRGEAYLKTGDGEQAITEYQKVLDHPGIMLNFVTGALAHLQLGRAQAANGDQEAAARSYRTFLGLWKDADPDSPLLGAAKTEYQRLQ